MRIGCGQGFHPGTSDLSSDAIGHTHRAAGPVVSPGTEPACGRAHRGVDDDPVDQAELGEVEGGIFLVDADDAYEMVKNLGHANCSQHGGVGVNQWPHF
ncbi:MAG TPA: hypothetical protein VND67_08075 [Acidimicrobiales bacterium]|nr:hypothetical protein [Acidimicrobiales bacterium]